MTRFEFHAFTKPTDVVLRDLKNKSADYWENLGRKMALRLFSYAVRTIPAYKRFLKKNGIKIGNIKTINDFAALPVMDKHNYLRSYDYLDLFPNRDLSKITTFSATSGSTGDPFYFPRDEEHDRQYEYIAELFLKNQFEIDKKSTLGIVGFGMGIWIGGIFTYKNFNKIATKGHNFSLIPAGTHKDIFLKSIRKFGHLYDQVVIMGYPPFIKDIVDEAPDYGVKWKDYNIRILTAAEGFSEEFREYLARKTSVKNPYIDIINIYGTVELGTMAHETALTSLIRRITHENKSVFSRIFPASTRMPTLAQYHPYLTYFEQVNGEVVATGYGSAIPLLRYRFPDMGDCISFDDMVTRLREEGIDIFREAKRARIDKTIQKLPFVYVYDRSDSAASLVGILIYPEYIKKVLQRPQIGKNVTGKFSMVTKNDKRQNQFLEVNIELSRGAAKNNALAKKIQSEMVKSFISYSGEYNHLYNTGSAKYRERLLPRIVLWPHSHPLYFRGQGKQKWRL